MRCKRFSLTTKMAAADVEQFVDSAIEMVLNKLDGIYFQQQMTALKAFVQKKDYFVTQCCVTCFLAMIGCRPIQLGPGILV